MRHSFTVFLILLIGLSPSSAFAKAKKRKAKQHPNYERYMNDEEYRSGRSTRLAGILLASIGGGTGGGILIGGMLWNMCAGATSKQKPTCRRNARDVMATGLVVTGGSLAVGIPLVTIGSDKMDVARRRIDGEHPVEGTDQEQTPAEKPVDEARRRSHPAAGLTLAVRVLNFEF